jgi:hypothetical protein
VVFQEDTREACRGAFGPPFAQPLSFRKTKTLHRIFEHDDNQQSYSWFFKRIQERMPFSAMLFGDAFSSNLSYLGKPRPFTECLNTMTVVFI